MSPLSQEWHTFTTWKYKRQNGDTIGNESIWNQYQLFHLFFFFFHFLCLEFTSWFMFRTIISTHTRSHIFRTMKYSNIKCQNAIQLHEWVCSGFVSCRLFLSHEENIPKQCQQRKHMMAEFMHSAYYIPIAALFYAKAISFLLLANGIVEWFQSHLSCFKVDFYNCTPFALRKLSFHRSMEKRAMYECICVRVCVCLWFHLYD